ncbi:MAG: adenylate/guanylate cyclase domain-containing protein [Betaproteobacteria bacterium]
MADKIVRALLNRWLVISAAIVAAIIFTHWLVVLPAPVALVRGESPVFVEILFRSARDLGSAWFLRLALGLIAFTGIAACALALIITLKAVQSAAIRYLAAALALCSLSTAYFFFAATHDVYRQLIGWSWGNDWCAFLDFVFYILDLAAPLFLIRFFRAYPRSVTDEQLLQHYRGIMAEARAKMSQGWRKRVYLQRGGDPEKPNEVERLLWRGAPQQTMAKVQRIWISSRMFYVAIGLALFAAIAGYLGRESLPMAGATTSGNVIEILASAASALVFLFFVYGAQVSFENLQFHHREALPEDRARIDWIYATMLFAGIVLLAVSPLWWALLLWLIPYMEARAIVPPGIVLFIGPTIISVELFVAAFVAALALSIFYKGAVDPRLAARKLTVFGLLGLVVAFLFVLLERTVALKIVAFFNLSPDTGALLAGAAVAASIAPIKNRAEKAVNLFVGRFLPLDSLIEGERKILTVAISDLSGYTSLSAKDEKQALLLAALLQRQAARLTEAHGGRIVKSMGDAVMFAFDDAVSTITVLQALHHDFAPAAGQLGVEALQVHSGAHTGEVTIAHDGDIYGQTVNIAARIQGSAAPGQIVVSESVAATAPQANYRDLGALQFKNVPEAIACRELLATVATTHNIASA